MHNTGPFLQKSPAATHGIKAEAGNYVPEAFLSSDLLHPLSNQLPQRCSVNAGRRVDTP